MPHHIRLRQPCCSLSDTSLWLLRQSCRNLRPPKLPATSPQRTENGLFPELHRLHLALGRSGSGRRRRGAIRGRHDQHQAARQGLTPKSATGFDQLGRYAPGPRLAVGADRARGRAAAQLVAPLQHILYGGVALLCLGVGAATFFIMSPPTDYIRREIIARVKAETGAISPSAAAPRLPSSHRLACGSATCRCRRRRAWAATRC